MKKILMLGTGGTLASSHGEKGLTPELHGNEILNKIAGLTDGFEVENEELFMLDSSNMQPAEWKAAGFRSNFSKPRMPQRQKKRQKRLRSITEPERKKTKKQPRRLLKLSKETLLSKKRKR